jgi:hypothetical protein
MRDVQRVGALPAYAARDRVAVFACHAHAPACRRSTVFALFAGRCRWQANRWRPPAAAALRAVRQLRHGSRDFAHASAAAASLLTCVQVDVLCGSAPVADRGLRNDANGCGRQRRASAADAAACGKPAPTSLVRSWQQAPSRTRTALPTLSRRSSLHDRALTQQRSHGASSVHEAGRRAGGRGARTARLRLPSCCRYAQAEAHALRSACPNTAH